MSEALQRINKIGKDYSGVFTVLGALGGGLVLLSLVRRLV